MDYEKIGKFIMNERKAQKLTQEKLGKKLFVSAKTISKWETGNGVPDTNTLPKLCKIFKISLNELLNGERISSQKYKEMAEDKLLELQKTKEYGDKALLFCEIVIVFLSTLILFSSIFVSFFFLE